MNTIKLTGVPNICLDLDTKELFLETLDEINTVARTAKQEIEERFIATIACKAAVKANMALTVEEVQKLLDDGFDVILEIDVQGAKQIKEIFPNTVLIFILAPSIKELKKRIIARGGGENREQLIDRFKTIDLHQFYN